MGFVANHNGLCSRILPEFQMVRSVVCSGHVESIPLRRRVLRKVDSELAKGNLKSALTLVKQLQGKPGGLRGFGAAKQVPQRHYSLEELDLNEVDLSSLQPLVDSIMDTIERSLQFAALDLVSSDGGVESSMLDTTDQFPIEDYHSMCMQHEAGHFLIAYLLGVLPRCYIVPSVEAMREDELVGGRVDFVGFEFLNTINAIKQSKKKAGKVGTRVNRGKISSKNLNRFSCVSLAGLVAEYLVFGYSEGSFTDIERLDTLLKKLGFTKTEADSQVRWTVLNTVLILHQHRKARSKLAEAMALARSVGFCIDTIENNLDGEEIL